MDLQYAVERAKLCMATAKEHLECALAIEASALTSDDVLAQVSAHASYASRQYHEARVWCQVAQALRTR